MLGPSDHYIAALTACTVADIPQDRVDDLVFRDSRLARALWWATLVDESILREWLASMGQRSADKRIAHLFCELLLRQQLVGTAGERDCPLPLTQPMLADILGITTIHVSRILRDLRLAGLIQLKERRLHVPTSSACRRSATSIRPICTSSGCPIARPPRIGRAPGPDARSPAPRRTPVRQA